MYAIHLEQAVRLIVLLKRDQYIHSERSELMGNQSNSAFVGVWQPVKAEVKLFKGIDVSFENAPYTLDLKEDGTATVTKEKAVSGTWTEGNGVVHVIAGNTDDVFKVKGDHLVLSGIAAELIFEKK